MGTASNLGNIMYTWLLRGQFLLPPHRCIKAGEVAKLYPMDFTRSSNSEGEDSVRSASDDSCGDYCPSGDTYDNEENLECSTCGASRENSKGGADDGDGSGDVDHVAEGCLHQPVAAKDFLGKEGFGVRKGDVARVNGVLIRRDFFYHRQGTRHPKHYDRPERIREERLESHTDCKAKLKIYYDMQHSVWRVRTIVDEHNHELAPPVFARLLPSHRKMSEGDKAQVDSLKQFGIATSKIMAYMAEQSGGYGMLRFTKRDVYNYVHRKRVARILGGDVAATIKFCKVFRNAIYANFEIREFEEYWKASMESLGLDDNNWVKSTYECRASWAMGHLRGTFCAGYKTTSRCEGINAFIKGFLKSTDSILELVHSLDRVIKDYQNNEVTAQFYSTYYSPVLTTGIDSIERKRWSKEGTPPPFTLVAIHALLLACPLGVFLECLCSHFLCLSQAVSSRS
ncbi:hypothetical protein Ahy_A04g019824 [Arachis hypogaea]|uniref:Uncharacterized protein n=1 Tax=Arachis hypogaea TaxID=3818 RepID=A0A445DGT8_ARAHY|nr:hypothetical protein Ahy_A04g019824 [Arachis hypogaea]